MPIPVHVDSSTVAITSVITSAIIFVFALVHKVPTLVALGIAAVVGIILYLIGAIPIGLIAIVGLALVVGIFKALMGKGK